MIIDSGNWERDFVKVFVNPNHWKLRMKPDTPYSLDVEMEVREEFEGAGGVAFNPKLVQLAYLKPKQENDMANFNVDNANDLEEPKQEGEPAEQQIERLARFIMANIPGEPSQSQGVVDTAIRLLTPAEPKEDIEFFKTSTPRPKMTNEDTRKRITNIIRENITFSGQIGDYIIHGAIEKLCDLIDENNRAWRDFHEQAEPKEEQGEVKRLMRTIDGQRIKLSRYWDIIQRFLERERDGGNQVLVKEIEELLKIQP